MYYLRKISRGKWPKEDEIAQASPKDVKADTVVSELKTESNKLSVWQVESDNDLENAFVALGSNCQNVGTIWAVKLSPDDLVGLGFDDEEGETPATALNGMHRNIRELTYASLGDVIGSILHALRNEGLVHKTRGEMKTLLAKAYANKMLDADGLNDSVLRDIKKELQRHPETTPDH